MYETVRVRPCIEVAARVCDVVLCDAGVFHYYRVMDGERGDYSHILDGRVVTFVEVAVGRHEVTAFHAERLRI